MGDLLSAVSGQFGKPLIIGTFFPCLLFVVINVVLVGQVIPTGWILLKPLESLDPQWHIIVITLISILLSVILFAFNSSVIHFFGGYAWEKGPLYAIYVRRKKYYERLHRSISVRWTGMRTLFRYITNRRNKLELKKDDVETRLGWVDETDPLYQKLNGEKSCVEHELKVLSSFQAKLDKARMQRGLEINFNYPHSRELVKATRLGNAIQSFEEYPQRQYKIDAVGFLPQLFAKMSVQYAADIENKKTIVDLLLNSSMLSMILALELLVAGVWSAEPFVSWQLGITWMFFIVTFVALSYICYLVVIDRAKAWGDGVKAAFDLYRWELLEQLGYKQKPSSRNEERAIWLKITQQTIYGDPPEGPLIDYQN
jgi:hypothetical protein